MIRLFGRFGLGVICIAFSFIAFFLPVRPVFADHLRNVRQNQILYVGVASNFSPFAYPGSDGTAQGIDIELAEAFADGIGTSVEIVEIAYAGLVDSLLAGQVDLIGGALPVEAGLTEILDYSTVYYQGEFGLMGLPGGLDGTAFRFEDLSWIRLGVQRGTVPEQFVRSYWIGSGRIAPDQVCYFDSREEAVEALNWGEIDYFLTTENIYKRRYELSGAYLWIQSDWLNVRFAFAARKGSTLIPEINRILTLMSADGTAQKIADAQLREARFAALPQDFSRAVPLSDVYRSRDCAYAARFLGDETLTEGADEVDPGAALEKRWRLMNIGSCAWTNGTVLVPITDAPAFSIVPLEEVGPGAVTTVSLPFTAPETPGSYAAQFRLSAPDGLDFGQILNLRLTVRDGKAPDG